MIVDGKLAVGHQIAEGRDHHFQVVAHGPLEKLNPQNSYASGTPATDGKRVYVNFRVGDDIVVAAHDPIDGRQLWVVQPEAGAGPAVVAPVPPATKAEPLPAVPRGVVEGRVHLVEDAEGAGLDQVDAEEEAQGRQGPLPT